MTEKLPSYKTDNGFYVGDKVEYEGKPTSIESIHSKGKWAWLEVPGSSPVKYYKAPCTIVKLANGRYTTDLRITRIA